MKSWLDHRVLVTVGTGGVGKTTVAAALGLEAARRGKRALVVTIDPARRLAAALGMQGSDSEPIALSAERLRQVGVEAPQECRVRPHVDCALIPSGQSRLPGPAMRCADREQAASIEPLAGDPARAGGMTGHQSPH